MKCKYEWISIELNHMTYSTRTAVTLSANSIATLRSATVARVTTLTSDQVVRTLSGSTSSARSRIPNFDVVGKTKELRGSLNASMSGDKGCHQRDSEHLGETHCFELESMILWLRTLDGLGSECGCRLELGIKHNYIKRMTVALDVQMTSKPGEDEKIRQ